ncbi:DUF6894 family protein [Bradyrhizobium sp. sGM-13]|uniref:DUF6894 family protein n=1 Tax=Bradyrhizobium sp. sGM-13 TaxID=2831781 RepID=UPI001BCBB3C1|nr:hypothetical protein [Bradyrhizobium sp. sGM-13]
MPRYYFDIREGDNFTADDEGLELTNLARARAEAAGAIADMARDAIRKQSHKGPGHQLAIEVRDGRRPVLAVKVSFEVDEQKEG